MVQTIFVRRILINVHETAGESTKKSFWFLVPSFQFMEIEAEQGQGRITRNEKLATRNYIFAPVRLSRGSRRSRSPSPSRLIPNTVMKIHRPGKSGSHQAVLM